MHLLSGYDMRHHLPALFVLWATLSALMFQKCGCTIPYCATLRMVGALSFVPSLCIQIWNNTQLSPVCSLKGKGPFHDVKVLTKEQNRKTDWAHSPRVAVRGSLRSKNVLADFRKQPSVDKDLANMDLSFQFGEVKQAKSFLVDKAFSLSALWDNEYIHYLWFDSFTGVRFSILLCAANLFMIWHRGLPNVAHDNSPYSWSTNTKLTVQYQQSEVMHFN